LQQLQLRQFHSFDVIVHPDGRYVAAALSFPNQEEPSILVVRTQMIPAPIPSGVCATIAKEKKTVLLILQNCIYLFVCFFLSFFLSFW